MHNGKRVAAGAITVAVMSGTLALAPPVQARSSARSGANAEARASYGDSSRDDLAHGDLSRDDRPHGASSRDDLSADVAAYSRPVQWARLAGRWGWTAHHDHTWSRITTAGSVRERVAEVQCLLWSLGVGHGPIDGY